MADLCSALNPVVSFTSIKKYRENHIKNEAVSLKLVPTATPISSKLALAHLKHVLLSIS